MKEPDVLAVIPARMGSKRFPGKVLHPFKGKPLLYYVWSQMARARRVSRLVIATDNAMIAKAARDFGAEVFRTSARHRTGSDRTAEVAERLGGKIVINVQADNFGLVPRIIDNVLTSMTRERSVRFATLVKRVDSDRDLLDPNCVKVAVNKEGRAVWFSRSPIPFLHSRTSHSRVSQFGFWGHLGVYFFRGEALRDYAGWPRTALEKAESLEQLRILEHGEQIRVYPTSVRTVSVDSPNDIRKIGVLYR